MVAVDKLTTTVGFIGLGVMGRSMAANLMAAGYRLVVYNRTRSKADELVKAGARWMESPAEVAKSADVVITIVGYPQDVEEVYLGQDGLIRHAKEAAYLIDMTTSSPLLARKIYEEAQAKHLNALDAPVSGGDVGARDAKLTIMVGGDREACGAVQPLFQAMGRNVVYQGPAGAGQHTKMCNQIAIASNMIGVCEAIAYAQKAGLNPETVLESIGSGAAGSWSLSNLAPRMIKGDFDPGFYVKHFIKDMAIALDSAAELGLVTPGLKLAKSLYDRLAAEGAGNDGTQALFKLIGR